MPINKNKLKITIKKLNEEEKIEMEFSKNRPWRKSKVSVKKKPAK